MADLREELAEYAHEAWSEWMKYLFSKCFIIPPEFSAFKTQSVIPNEFTERWTRQMNTAYTELSEEERESDRIEADKILAIMEKYKYD